MSEEKPSPRFGPRREHVWAPGVGAPPSSTAPSAAAPSPPPFPLSGGRKGAWHTHSQSFSRRPP
eukprot:9149687-Pyramimonas_sp.AAC.1